MIGHFLLRYNDRKKNCLHVSPLQAVALVCFDRGIYFWGENMPFGTVMFLAFFSCLEEAPPCGPCVEQLKMEMHKVTGDLKIERIGRCVPCMRGQSQKMLTLSF